ncbi:MAG: sulfite exporter TauE/SafE family protein [Pseudomonadota bacterium]
MLDLQYIIYVELIVAFAAFAQGFTGLGFGIIAIAGIAFTPWDLERASVVTNILLIVLNCTIIYAGRKDSKIDWKLVGIILAGESVGVPIGYWFIFTFGNRPVFRLVLGMVLLIFALHVLFRPSIRKKLHMAVGIAAGIAGGFFAGAFTAGGPPLALFVYSRQKNPADAKGTLQIVFMAATLWRLFNIILFGKGVSLEVFRIAALSFPVVIIFAIMGYILTKHLSNETFLKIVYTLIGSAGVLNMLKGLLLMSP